MVSGIQLKGTNTERPNALYEYMILGVVTVHSVVGLKLQSMKNLNFQYKGLIKRRNIMSTSRVERNKLYSNGMTIVCTKSDKGAQRTRPKVL